MTRAPRLIALLFEFPTLHGGERSMLACLEEFQQHGFPTKIVAVAPPEGPLAEALAALHLEHIPWTILGRDPFERGRLEDELCDRISALKPDLLHANSLAMGRLSGRLSTRLPLPTTAHLRDIIKLSRAAVADLNRNRRLLAVSSATRLAHLAQGLDPERVQVLHNGVDLSQFRPQPRPGALRSLLKLPSSAVVLATIGQIGLRKGQGDLAEAAPAIAQAVPDAHFVLIGECVSTKTESREYSARIDTAFATHGLRDRFHRLGYRMDVADLLADVDVLIHPARQEPYGRVLLEAAACGVPVVATDVGGTSEIVVPNETGLLVPAGLADPLTEGVIRLICDEDLRKQLGKNARHRAETCFGRATAAQQLWQHWCDVAGQH